MSLPPGIRRQHRNALASARRLREQLFQLFLASFRTDSLDREAANGLHQQAVDLCDRLERLPRASLAPTPRAAGGGA